MAGVGRRLDTLARHLGARHTTMAAAAEGRLSSLTLEPTSSPGASSAWESVQQAPEDPILGVTVAYNKDSDPRKVNLGVGAYRTEEGKPLVLEVVRKVETAISQDRSQNHEYLGIIGVPAFNKLSAKLILGPDSSAIKEDRVTTVQCLSGTGSLRVGAEFIARHYPYHRTIYVPNPTWGNHNKIFPLGGVEVKHYRYYDPSTRGLDYEGMCSDLESAPSGCIVLLHACAHNPTGVDPTPEQWEGIRRLVRQKGLLPFFDSAYQGFATGDLNKDALPVRTFADDGGELMIAQSYAKNMGLYGERVGALSAVCRSSEVARRVESQLKLVIRPMYSNPPAHGANIVAAILGDRALFDEWMVELKGMADRIIRMRHQLYEALQERGKHLMPEYFALNFLPPRTPGDWSHILKQIGMFTFTGLTKEQVNFMTKEYHIYMTSDGRISMAGLNSRTVPHLADAIHAAVNTISH
eukprot:SM000107S14033  [mRNA]  locus=s107:11063:15025:- [translate_table: standard]